MLPSLLHLSEIFEIRGNQSREAFSMKCTSPPDCKHIFQIYFSGSKKWMLQIWSPAETEKFTLMDSPSLPPSLSKKNVSGIPYFQQ